MAVIAPELEATGWVPVDEMGRYLRHEARFGPAIFDRFEADQIQTAGGGEHNRRAELRLAAVTPASLTGEAASSVGGGLPS